MLNLFSMFGRSPFALLRTHMERVVACVEEVGPLFEALKAGNVQAIEDLAVKISDLEHKADLAKNEIRNHLPKSLFLPIDRGALLEILECQDEIADHIEDLGLVLTLKPISFKPEFEAIFFKFLDKNLETFEWAKKIIHELDELLESTFGGIEAEKVRSMAHIVAVKEHEADLIQREFSKALFRVDNQLSYSEFHLWEKVCLLVASISNLSEKLANRVRMTLDVK